MTHSDAAQVFLKRFVPSQTQSATPEQLAHAAQRLPPALLEVWQRGGLGKYGGGLLELIDPQQYQEVLGAWLNREDDGTRTPFMLTAYGVVYYWRCLGEADEHGQYQAYDVAYFSPHDSDTEVCAWSMEDFLGEYLVEEPPPYELDPYGLWEDMRERAAQELPAGYMYGFVPALWLGGEPSADSAVAQAALEHLYLLRGLAE